MTPLAAALAALLLAEHVPVPDARMRVAATIAACHQAVADAAGTDAGRYPRSPPAGGVGLSSLAWAGARAPLLRAPPVQAAVVRCVAVAFVESRLVEDAIGDHGRALGAWQVHASVVPLSHDACGVNASPLTYEGGACIAVAVLAYYDRRCGRYRAVESYHRGRCARPGAYQRRVERVEGRLR